MNEAQATPIRDALRDVQEMWDELHRRGLNPQIMRRYSDAISVLERDFTGRLAAGVATRHPRCGYPYCACVGECFAASQPGVTAGVRVGAPSVPPSEKP